MACTHTYRGGCILVAASKFSDKVDGNKEKNVRDGWVTLPPRPATATSLVFPVVSWRGCLSLHHLQFETFSLSPWHYFGPTNLHCVYYQWIS